MPMNEVAYFLELVEFGVRFILRLIGPGLHQYMLSYQT